MHKYFLDSQTPAQKAADTTRRRREAKDAELRLQHLGAEATKKLARSVLHDENADTDVADILHCLARFITGLAITVEEMMHDYCKE